MIENSIKSEIVSSGDESQVHYVENAPHLQYMPLNKDNFEIANAYNLKLRKKKRIRTAFTTDQVLLLENTFSERKYIDKWTRKKLAKHLKISEKNVKVWFQNRRMKNKRLSSESSDSCETNVYSKNNESDNNGNTSWELHVSSSSENSINQNNISHSQLDIKSNEVKDSTPPIPYDETNESFYYPQQFQQQYDGQCVPNFAFNTDYSNCYDYINNYYYYNPVDYYDYSVYNNNTYNWPQYYTN